MGGTEREKKSTGHRLWQRSFGLGRRACTTLGIDNCVYWGARWNTKRGRRLLARNGERPEHHHAAQRVQIAMRDAQRVVGGS